MKLVQLVDSLEYLNTNCWQHQLREHLSKQADQHIIVTKAELAGMRELPEADVLLSTLKLRSIFGIRRDLAQLIGDRHIHIYDQDPWEAFINTASYPGAYETLDDCLNVTFINTSEWWTDYVKSRGMSSIFTRMWMKKEYCHEGVPWSSRPIRVGFKGHLHPYRQKAIEKLASMGVEVTVLKPGDYQSFLSDLSQMQFFFHEEGNDWAIGDWVVGNNACWAKEIEIASQGCFALRKYEPEADAYQPEHIPAFKTYTTLEDIPKIIDDALQNPALSDSDSRLSVDVVRGNPGWFDLTDLT